VRQVGYLPELQNSNIDFSIGSGTTDVLGGRVGKTRKKLHQKKEYIK